MGLGFFKDFFYTQITKKKDYGTRIDVQKYRAMVFLQDQTGQSDCFSSSSWQLGHGLGRLLRGYHRRVCHRRDCRRG